MTEAFSKKKNKTPSEFSLKTQAAKKEYIRKNIPLTLMALPAIIIGIMFLYIPMFGLIMGFQNFTYPEGIFGSQFVGLDNFKYIFSSGDIITTLMNTVGYHLLFNVAVTLSSLFLAIMLYFIKNDRRAKTYQKTFIIPYLVSYVVISYIVYILLNNEYGLLNQLFEKLGKESISWYTTPIYWPFILTIVQIWFGAGIKSVYYYGSLMAVDQSIFEAADLDGASKLEKIRYIMLPSLAPTISIFLILDLGNILSSSFELFYSIPMDSSALYSVTDVLSTYTYRGLVTAEIGTTTALGLFTGVVTTVATLLVNAIVKKISPENSLL